MVGDDKPLLYNMLLSGASGCGKTETVLAMRYLLGMEPGYEYEHAFVEIDGSVMTQESQVNCITGAAAGLVGYKDGNTLADQLNYAINPLYKPQLAETETQQPRKSATASAAKKSKTNVQPTPPPPPVIMLFIDEVDKVSYEFLKSINGLLDKGTYRTPSGVSFVLPRGTAMLIVFTSNYGADEIAAMKTPYDEEAEQYVRRHMRECGIQPYTMGRMGDILPYYPLKGETLRALLTEKLQQYLEKSLVAQQLAHSHKIQYDDDFKELLVNYVHQKVDGDHGVRGAIRQLFQKLDLLFSKAVNILKAMMEEDEADEGQSLHLTGHSFNVQQFTDQVQHEWAPIIDSICQNPANTQILAKWREQPSTEAGILNAMGMRLGQRNLCHFVLPVVNLNLIVAENDGERTRRRESEKRAKKLRDVVVKVDEIVNTEGVDARKAIKKIKRLTHKQKTLLQECTYSDSDEDEPRIQELTETEEGKKRKNETTATSEHSPKKKAKHVAPINIQSNSDSEKDESAKQGKKWQRRQNIDGFTYERYHKGKKKYRCDRCGHGNIDYRYTALHHCHID